MHVGQWLHAELLLPLLGFTYYRLARHVQALACNSLGGVQVYTSSLM